MLNNPDFNREHSMNCDNKMFAKRKDPSLQILLFQSLSYSELGWFRLNVSYPWRYFFYSLVRPQRPSIQCWHFGCLGRWMPHHKRWMAMEQLLGFMQQHKRIKNSKHHLEGQGLLKETYFFFYDASIQYIIFWRWASVGSTTGLMSKRFQVKGELLVW